MADVPLYQSGSQKGRLGQIALARNLNSDADGQAYPYVIESVSLSGATYQLLVNATDDGDPVGPVVGGSYIWALAGTVGGATIKLQALGPDGVTYLDVAGASMTAVGSMTVQAGAGAYVKAVVTGGAPSGLYSNLT